MVCLRGLQWWLHLPRLYLGVSLHQVSPVLHFWSDASDVDWGSHLDCQVASGLWDTLQAALSIYARERRAVQLGLCQFRSPLRGRTVAVFCDKPQLCIPLGALLALFYERGVVLLGEVIAAARAARPQVGSLRAHKVR